ncbi:radical SAM protein (plasmid) [Clostridium beijerinckii]|uniref:radical SAM protein n=1 Tax=Clostridium beijerinckii TaxID=1520 RepID=UPI0022261596|nr:radical SAM protein [Clostridium beijerinckii]UYZ39023.1 radical SAM protein [Clostridium beijerinckii]
MLPRGLTIYLTDKCLISCKHCEIRNKFNGIFLDFEIIKKVLLDCKENKVFIIGYTGGEALLHPELFKILEQTYNSGILPVVGISGVRINKNIAKKLSESKIGCVQVSLDGSSEKVNSIFRGSGVFEDITSGIKLLQDYGVNTNIAICICKENFDDYKNLIELCYDLRAYKLKIQFYMKNYMNRFSELDENEKNEIVNFINEFQHDKKLVDWAVYPNTNNNLGKIHQESLIIFPNGDVQLSEFDNKIGNINQNKLSFLYEQYYLRYVQKDSIERN